MDIIIISEFCDDFSKSDNDRFLYLAKMLAKENQVEIITSSFRHADKKHRREPVERWPIKITFIEEPGYSRNICLKRFQSHYIWGKNVKKYLKNRKKPDVVYCAVPSLSGPYRIARYCVKEKIKYIIDVQDLWPEAFQMIVNIPLVTNFLFLPFRLLANGIYKRADRICGVSDTYCIRAAKKNKKIKQTTTVFLGTDLTVFDRYAAQLPMMQKDDKIWLAYCGTLGSSYDLKGVINALEILDDPQVRFIVMGDGPKREEFQQYARKKKVSVSFVGRLEYDAMCSLLNVCDIMINPIAHLAAQSIINKHADYAASGKPVVSTQESEEYIQLIDDYQMGYNCSNRDYADLAEKIRILIADKGLRTEMGRNARRCAEEKFNRAQTYQYLISSIMK